MLRHVIHRWERKLSRRDVNRMAIPFDWGLDFLGEHIATLPSRRSQGKGRAARDLLFALNERALSESDHFFTAPPVRDFAFDGEWLTFPSHVRSPFARNNTVHARYFPVAAHGKASETSEVERARRRAVIVLPQWNADPESHVGLCALLNRVDIAALRLSLPYHDRRTPEGL